MWLDMFFQISASPRKKQINISQLPAMSVNVLIQSFSWLECFVTLVAWKWHSLQMISLNVVPYHSGFPLFTTYLANLCFLSAISIHYCVLTRLHHDFTVVSKSCKSLDKSLVFGKTNAWFSFLLASFVDSVELDFASKLLTIVCGHFPVD